MSNGNNSPPPHNFPKLSLIEAYDVHHHFYLKRLSEIYLDSSFVNDNPEVTLKKLYFD